MLAINSIKTAMMEKKLDIRDPASRNHTIGHITIEIVLRVSFEKQCPVLDFAVGFGPDEIRQLGVEGVGIDAWFQKHHRHQSGIAP